MLTLLCLMAAAAVDAPATATAPVGDNSPARRVIEWQLQSAPRPEARPSLSAGEAEAIHKRYLASIGETLAPSADRPGGAR